MRIGNNYYSNKLKYHRIVTVEQIMNKVNFACPNIHVISDNTCIVALKETHSDDLLCYDAQVEIDDEPRKVTIEIDKYNPSICEVLNLFEKFIGKDYLYDIKILGNLLIIMLRNRYNSKNEFVIDESIDASKDEFIIVPDNIDFRISATGPTSIPDIGQLIKVAYDNQIKRERTLRKRKRSSKKTPEKSEYMSVLSRFYGITIRMHFLQKENKPHTFMLHTEDT